MGPSEQRAVLVAHLYGSSFPVIHYCIAHAAATAAFVTGTFCLSPFSSIGLCCLLSDQKLCELNAEHPCSGSLVSGVVAQANQDTASVFSCQVGNANLCHQTDILDVNVFMWSPPCAFSPPVAPAQECVRLFSWALPVYCAA